MNLENVRFQYRGKTFEGKIAIPSDIAEAVAALGEEEVFRLFLQGYEESQKKRIRTRRKKRVILDLQRLTDEQRQSLIRAGLLKEF